MGVTLHQHGHSHDAPAQTTVMVDEESQGLLGGGDTKPESTNKAANINVRAAFIHVVGDLIQSVGVFTAALVIYYKVSTLYTQTLVFLHLHGIREKLYSNTIILN